MDGDVSMKAEPIKLLDAVALLADLPEHSLRMGQMGTVVEELDATTFEVEFSDDQGRTYAQLPLRTDQLLRLLHEPVRAA